MKISINKQFSCIGIDSKQYKYLEDAILYNKEILIINDNNIRLEYIVNCCTIEEWCNIKKEELGYPCDLHTTLKDDKEPTKYKNFNRIFTNISNSDWCASLGIYNTKPIPIMSDNKFKLLSKPYFTELSSSIKSLFTIFNTTYLLIYKNHKDE